MIQVNGFLLSGDLNTNKNICQQFIKKPEPEEDILDLTALEEEEEIKIGIPEDLEKKDRVVIDEFLKGPGMPHRKITGVAKTIENRWKYWAYTIRDMVQLTYLNEDPEMNKIMRAIVKKVLK